MTRRKRRPGTVERAVIAAAREAGWVDDDLDGAAIWTLRTIAETLDAHRRATLDLEVPMPARDIAELSGRAIQLLRELGLTPAARARFDQSHDQTSTYARVLALAAGRDPAES